MSLFINADDFGLCDGADRRILSAFDHGVLSGASILPNGIAFDSAVRAYRERPRFVLSVHLNFVDGDPVAGAANVPSLVDAKGKLNSSFCGLWMKYLLATKSQKQQLTEEVRRELRAQIVKVKAILHRGAELRVDSHRHLHMIPFVFRAVVDIAKELKVDYIRLPREPFFFYRGQSTFWRAYLGSNLLKHMLLRILSTFGARLCKENKISSCDNFVGVLFTGNITLGVTRAAISQLPSSQTTEVLFHPGRPDDDEKHLFEGRQDLLDYYFDEWRERELNTLLSPEFKRLITTRGEYESVSGR